MSSTSNKIGRPTVSKHKKRDKIIKIYVNDIEHEKYETLKNRLSSSSPALSGNDFFRLILEKLDDDDGALFKWLNIHFLDPLQAVLIKTKRTYNKKTN